MKANLIAAMLAGGATVAHARDQAIEPGRTYTVVIAREVSPPFVGQLGIATIDGTDVAIAGARVGERFAVTARGTVHNRWTGRNQLTCGFRRIGVVRTGECSAPG